MTVMHPAQVFQQVPATQYHAAQVLCLLIGVSRWHSKQRCLIELLASL